MFSGESIPPLAKGSTWSTTYPGHGPVRPAVDGHGDFEEVAAQTGSLSRALPSRPPVSGGMVPAAKWGNLPRRHQLLNRAGGENSAIIVQAIADGGLAAA
jgi:hypothetical protein